MSLDALNYDRLIVAYHGCDASIAAQLLAGTSFRSSQNRYDWLGEGIYFWEFGHDRALKFAEQQRARGRVSEPAVVGAILQLGRCFDLMDTRYTAELRRSYLMFSRAKRRSDEPMPRNHLTRDRLLRHRDCAVINFHMALVAEQGVAYDSVRCAFAEGPPAFPGAGIRAASHIQIAIRNPSCIIGVFRPKMEQPS